MKTIEALIDILKKSKEELAKGINQSYSGAPNGGMGKGDGDAQMTMSEKEPHKDDPKHEAKEKVKAKKIKAEAQDLLDMHKADGSMEKMCMHKNGQWEIKKSGPEDDIMPPVPITGVNKHPKVKKASTDEDIAEVYHEEVTNPRNMTHAGTKVPGMSARSKPWASGGRGSTKDQIHADFKAQKPAPVRKPKI